ncbi:MAG: DUF58 domain-containing protein [Bacteroidetes bacterium]|nr:MAG: DUF58 domain-containing protein [Bacteroidota bacterium]
METKELIKKVRKIEIKTKGISNQVFAGSYQSAFKGKGMAFTEVREYQFGDDIRSIDWNVTARFNHPYVKIFEEERELTVMLLIDVSGSNAFGSRLRLKEEMVTEISAVLAFSAIQNNDKVGVIFFSSTIEKFIPPKKGTSHILRIIRELIDFKPREQGTDIGEALKYMRNVIKKRSIAFLISDFQDKGFEDALSIVSKKHDLVGIRVFDELERHIPAAGIMRLKDAETGSLVWADTSSSSFRQELARWNANHERYLLNIFRKASVDFTSIATHQDYVPPLIGLFKRRI